MSFLIVMDRLVIPAVIAIFLAGGIAGLLLGCGLLINERAALRFITRMNRWVSTREAFARLDTPINLHLPGTPGQRRPLLGTLFLVGGLAVIALLLVRLDLPQARYVPGSDVKTWLATGVVMGTLKWVLVAGSAFTALVGVLMLFAPQRLAVLEQQLNAWHSSDRLMAASDRIHTPLEPRVEAHPKASGWIIVVASLFVVLAMIWLLLARLQ